MDIARVQSDSLRSSYVGRVKRLPKPRNATEAIQPLFEAVSNSIHSTQARFGDKVREAGRVLITLSLEHDKKQKTKTLLAEVEDNGVGLDEENWAAFQTTDTDHKIARGGKGVGRLYWLDCFETIKLSSVFRQGEKRSRRAFDFVLAETDQFANQVLESMGPEEATSCHVRFSGFAHKAYQDKFPSQPEAIFQHVASHFLPIFIGEQSPTVILRIGDEERSYPEAIHEIIKRRETAQVAFQDFGDLKVTMLECDKVASTNMQGANFVHFIAHDRTVHSQCVDGKLGFKHFGDQESLAFHATLVGEHLDLSVNQERTGFSFEDSVLGDIVTEAFKGCIERFLAAPLGAHRARQKEVLTSVTATYPSVAFEADEQLQKRLPVGLLKPDAIYGNLSQERCRRDMRQSEKIREALTRLKSGDFNAEAFRSTLAEASTAIEETMLRSLAEYTVRRKVVIDFMQALIRRIGDRKGDSQHQPEEVLHSFICPMRVGNLPNGDPKIRAASHDLWLLDERLTFSQYFASDLPFTALAEETESTERADLLLFDRVHGMRDKGDRSRVMLVEFKKPGRTEYAEGENPADQIKRYILELQKGRMVDVEGQRLPIDKETFFHAFIVADLTPKLEFWTMEWTPTLNGRGRILQPSPASGFKGTIELIEWEALLDDARARNQGFFEKAGLPHESFFDRDPEA